MWSTRGCAIRNNRENRKSDQIAVFHSSHQLLCSLLGPKLLLKIWPQPKKSELNLPHILYTRQPSQPYTIQGEIGLPHMPFMGTEGQAQELYSMVAITVFTGLYICPSAVMVPILNSNRSRPKIVSLSFVKEDETRKRWGARCKVTRYVINP